MANEVEIRVVASKRAPNLRAIGDQIKRDVGGGVKAAMAEVDKSVTQGAKETGAKAGQAMQLELFEGLDKGVKDGTKQTSTVLTREMRKAGRSAGAAVSEELGKGVGKDVAGRLRDAKGRFVAEARKMGDEAGRAAGDGTRRGLLSRMASAGGGAAKTLLRGFKGMLGDAIGAMRPVYWAVLVGIVALAPVAGGAAAAALVLAFGLGLAALPIIALARTKEVKKAFKDTAKDIGKEFRAISTPFRDTLDTVLKVWRETWKTFEKPLEKAFRVLGPATSDFIEALGEAFEELAPAMEPIAWAFHELVRAMGPKLETLFEDIAAALIDLAETVAENPDLFADLFVGLLYAIPWVIRIVDKLAEFGDWLEDHEDEINVFSGFLRQLGDAFEYVANAIGWVSRQWDKVKDFFDKPPSLAFKADTGAAKQSIGDLLTQAGRWAGNTFWAMFGGRTSSVSKALRRGLSIGASWAGRVFNAIFSSKTGGVSAALRRGLALGGSWAHRTFIAPFTGATGGAARALGRALGIGGRWARRRFSAAFGAFTSSVRRAFNSAVATGRSWASRVFTATFNVVRSIVPGLATGGIVGALAAAGAKHAAGGGGRGGDVLVGEHGPEIARLPYGSSVTPAGATRARMGGAGRGDARPFHVTIQIGDKVLGELLIDPLRKTVQGRGGLQAAFRGVL